MFQPKIKYVPSGEFIVSKSAPLILQAILGTCVGVAAYDPENRVGGLLHLLLPEPVSLGMRCRPERYASTGLPLFLKALFEAGASKKTLRVVIAGGALVGPVNEQDLALDIGGKTAEIAKTILDENKIYIEASETGGGFTCSLNLNLANWKVYIEPSYFKQNEFIETIPAPDRSQVECAIEKILPIPQVALKVLRIIYDDNYSPSKIAEEIKKDQVLSARTLKLCNSALYGLRHRIESLEDALILLGRNRFIQMVLSAAVKNYFNQSGFGYSICKGGLYHHAIGNAVITEKISAHTGDILPGIAYIAGLMHDIGKVVLDQYISSAYPFLYRKAPGDPVTMLEIEKETFGIDHTEVGCLLAQRWGLPDTFTEVIKWHHAPEKSFSSGRLPYIVYLSDVLMSRFQAGFEIEMLDTGQLLPAMNKIGLTMSQFPSIVDLVPHQTIASDSVEN